MNNISRVICVILSISMLLSACSAPTQAPVPASEPEPSEAPAPQQTQKPEDKPDPDALKVWPDPSIEGNLPDDPTPGSDFAAYINHDWYKSTTIPEGYTKWSSFSELQENVKAKLFAMFDEPDDSPEQQKAAALFASAMDKETRDSAGIGTIMRSFNFVRDVKSLTQMSELLVADGNLYYFTPLLVTNVSADNNNSSINVAKIYAPILSLEDSAEYSKMTEQGERFKKANEKYYKALLTHNGIDEAEADKLIFEAYAFEEKLAANIYPLSVSYRPDFQELIYNEYSPEELTPLCPDFPLTAMLETAGLGQAKRFIVSEPEAMKTLNAEYTEENLEGIKAYVMINLLTYTASYADSFSADATAQWENDKYGGSGLKPDKDRAYELCSNLLGELIGTAYAKKYFSEDSKADILSIVNDITGAMKARLESADWLSEATRHTAIEKLDTMTLRIAYPTSYACNWDDIAITAENSLLENAVNIIVLTTAQRNATADKPVDKEVWGLSASTVNAFYEPSDNSINFPAAILQAPFYDKDASRSANLGGIGVVIAHEISHAFDTQGSQYDKNGNMTNWWTDEDRAAFKERTDKVDARYSAVEVVNGEHVHGDLTIGETVADLGGVACGLDAMHKLDDPNYEEFFTSFAEIWAERITPEMRVYQLKTNPHAPGYLRANITVQQFQEFYDAFGVKEGDFMYTAPEDRLKVW